MLRGIPSQDGIMDAKEIEKRIIPKSIHTPGTTLLCLENTHNRAGGTITPLQKMNEAAELAKNYDLKIHLDGARVFNAAIALGVDVREMTSNVDSVMFCLSKGLGSPVGSILCGTRAFIEKARLWRKRLGGGMRQSGILAACGIVSLTQNIERLAIDHEHTKQFANSLQGYKEIHIDVEKVQTNIVMIHTKQSATKWGAALSSQGIKILAFGPNTLRAVFHYDVTQEMVETAIQVFQKLAQ